MAELPFAHAWPGERSMDGTIVNVAIYLTATFAAALVTGGCGVCIRISRRRRLAAYPYTDADRNIDHRLRSRGAGHFSLEATPRAAVEPAVAIPARGGLWSPSGRGDSRIGPS